jgi:hypothetical protein
MLTLMCHLSICSHRFNFGVHIEITMIRKRKIRIAGIRIKMSVFPDIRISKTMLKFGVNLNL